MAPLDFELLSNRELEILKLAANGRLDKEIVSELGVSINTLRTYWNRIRSKLGDRSRSAFAAAWVSSSLRQRTEPSPFARRDFHICWEFDAQTRLVTAPSTLNEPLGLESGQGHPADLYKALLEPSELLLVSQAVETAIVTGQRHFSVTHRTLRKSGPTCDHTFGTIFRDDAGNLAKIEGHTVLLKSCDEPTNIKLGLWSKPLESDEITMDTEALTLFGLDHDSGSLLTCNELLRVVKAEDREQLLKLLSVTEVEPSQTLSFSIRLADESKSIHPLEVRARVQKLPGAKAVVSGSVSHMPLDYFAI